MLRNDTVGPDKTTTDKADTRDLKNTVVRHHKNNPQSSMEAAFEYIMLNSATFRALPTACIEKARKHLDLPIVGIKPKEVTSGCKPSLFLVTQDEITPMGWKCNELPTFDIRVALGSMGIPSSDEKGNPDIPSISIPRLNKDRLAEFINRVTRNASTHETTGHTFGKIRRESAEFMQMNPIDIHNAWTQITEIQANKSTKAPDVYIPSPGTETVDHLVCRTNDIAKLHPGRAPRWIFDYVRHKMHELKPLHTDDVYEARSRLGLLNDEKGKTKVSGPQVEYSPTYLGSESMIRPKPKSCTTVVHAERVVVDNKKMIKILTFENVRLLSNLPNKYNASQPIYCWFRSGIELKYYDAPYTIHQNVLPGDIMSLKEFGKMIKTMKDAGARLAKINKTTKLKKEHSGKFTVEV